MNKYLMYVPLILWGFAEALGLGFGDNQVQGADREEYPFKNTMLAVGDELPPTEYTIVDGQLVRLEHGLDLSDKDLSGVQIHNRTLVDVDFSGSNFHNADLSQTRFLNCSFRGANFNGVVTYDTTFEGCDFNDVWFENVFLSLTGERLMASRNFKEDRFLSHCSGNSLPLTSYANNIDYSGFLFSSVYNFNAEGGTFTDASFADCAFINMTKDQLASTWNYKKRDLDSLSLNNTKDEKISLSGLDLSNFRIRRLSLTNYDVTDVDFTDAMIWETLEFISCSGVTKEQLQSTWNWKTGRFDFCLLSTELDWSNTDFSGFTFCRESRLSGNVTGADFTDAKFLTVLSPKFTTKSSALEHCQGLTLEQVKSTWNYKTGNMEGVVLPEEVQRQLDAETTAAPE